MIKKKIKKEHVIEFLEKNPNFFIDNSSLLEKISFPLGNEKNDKSNSKIIPFKDWIIQSLRSKQKNIIDNAHHNFLTQKRIHKSIIDILKINEMNTFIKYIVSILPKTFNLEVINFVTSDQNIAKKYKFIYKDNFLIENIYGKERQLIMDAVEHQTAIFEDIDKKVYSNAIFSLNKKIFGSPSLLVFGSKGKHFIDNKAYDLILFFSNVVQEQILKLSNE